MVNKSNRADNGEDGQEVGAAASTRCEADRRSINLPPPFPAGLAIPPAVSGWKMEIRMVCVTIRENEILHGWSVLTVGFC